MPEILQASYSPVSAPTIGGDARLYLQREEMPMGVGSILRFFLPQDDKFLPYFEQSADNLKEAAGVYASLAKAGNHEELGVVRDRIKKLEHVGDKLTHTIFEELNRSFITPFDREDIYSLTKSMDDVLDSMDRLMQVFQRRCVDFSGQHESWCRAATRQLRLLEADRPV
jgi:hypothetical protein